MTNSEKLKELQALRSSRGWVMWQEVLRADIMNAALAMGDNPNMPESEMHFRRGAIYAARSHITALDMLISNLEAEELMTQHTDTTERT